jgi:hypothetical protein
MQFRDEFGIEKNVTVKLKTGYEPGLSGELIKVKI